jgi:hypothetical protein
VNYVVDAEIECPYCGESFTISVDTSQGDYSMIEDCTVCCRPMSIELQCAPGEVLGVEVNRS